MLLSLVICTYNRDKILDPCLKALISQSQGKSNIEILVIDNNSSDETERVVQNYQKAYPELRYFLEEKQGISNARNRGMEEAKGEWIGYIDDDAIVDENFVNESLLTINQREFDAFGGKITSYFKYGQPRWLKDNFESNVTADTSKGSIPPDQIYGAALFIKKKILKEYNGFNSGIGMKGKKIAYGEEPYLMEKIHSAGYRLGINPAIVICHLVPKKKLKMWWHIKARFATGRDTMHLLNAPNLYYQSTIGVFLAFWKGGKRFLKEKDFYIENYFLLIMQQLAFIFGIISHYLPSSHNN